LHGVLNAQLGRTFAGIQDTESVRELGDWPGSHFESC
jgi:hypothetical protein